MKPKESIEHILVGHCFDENSEAALQYAIALARRQGARVTVLHAYEVPSMGAPEVLVLATDWIKQFAVVSRDKLGQVVAGAENKGVPITAEVREGPAWREISAFAKERQVDLIVVGSHCRRGLPRALLGSVAEKVVRTAPCPVLVVPGARDA